MSYTIYLFRKEVQEEQQDFSFLEEEDKIKPFTPSQFQQLKERLLAYGFQLEKAASNSLYFNYKGGLYGIQAVLHPTHLSFSSGYSQEGIFEIGMTASEFTDSGEFAKLDLQAEGWEEV